MVKQQLGFYPGSMTTLEFTPAGHVVQILKLRMLKFTPAMIL